MAGIRQTSLRLGRVAGIDLDLHWSWFLLAVFQIWFRHRSYRSLFWNALEYGAIFAIVLLHELGHVLACRQVGGRADRILLWPLGGVAYVHPPQRPGATLWSVAAGPLVNLALVPLLWAAMLLAGAAAWSAGWPDALHFLGALFKINLSLLVFNLIPVFPLDGGQMARSLLWFALGRARSLMAVAVLGLAGVFGFALLAAMAHSGWLLLIAGYMAVTCVGALQQARALGRIDRLPRREGFACPECATAPPMGVHWQCRNCGQGFDTFASAATCPACRTHYDQTTCIHCQTEHSIEAWRQPPPPPPDFLPGHPAHL